MTREGFETTIPVFKRAKTFHASDRAITMIGILRNYGSETLPVIERMANVHLSDLTFESGNTQICKQAHQRTGCFAASDKFPWLSQFACRIPL
jgi:hypothetical protein